jgi:hypothetical protein
LERATLELQSGVFRQQVLSDCIRVRGRASLARLLTNAVDPGWVPTKMGGPSAPDDFEQGYLTQTWLAVSDDPGAMVSGRYWHHRRPQTPAEEACDSVFQDELSAKLAELTRKSLC